MQEKCERDNTKCPQYRKSKSAQLHENNLENQSFPLTNTVWCDCKKDKETDESYSDSMKSFFCTTSFEFSEVVASWNDRESCSLWLEHDDYDDDKCEDDEESVYDLHGLDDKWWITRQNPAYCIKKSSFCKFLAFFVFYGSIIVWSQFFSPSRSSYVPVFLSSQQIFFSLMTTLRVRNLPFLSKKWIQ